MKIKEKNLKMFMGFIGVGTIVLGASYCSGLTIHPQSDKKEIAALYEQDINNEDLTYDYEIFTNEMGVKVLHITEYKMPLIGKLNGKKVYYAPHGWVLSKDQNGKTIIKKEIETLLAEDMDYTIPQGYKLFYDEDGNYIIKSEKEVAMMPKITEGNKEFIDIPDGYKAFYDAEGHYVIEKSEAITLK